MADTPEAVKKSIKTYLFIGCLLFAFTGITVLVASWEVLDFGRHGFDTADAVIGLLIALFKASCVAAIFMHLNHEKKGVYWIFGGSLVFCAAMFALIGLAKSDPIDDPYFYRAGDSKITPPAVSNVVEKP